MAPILGLGLGLLFSWWLVAVRVVSVAFILLGALLFWVHNRGGFRSLRIPGIMSCCIGVAGLVFLHSSTPTLQDKAESVMDLPQGAQIIRVKEGELAENGSVSFKLPATRPVNDWLDLLWQMNVKTKGITGGGVTSHITGNDRGLSYSEGYISLSYDEKAKIYSYECEID